MNFRMWFEGSEQPRLFYRGSNPGDTRRIKTGFSLWDSFLFVTDKPENARWYGDEIEIIKAKPSAHIVYEGTKEFISLKKGLTLKGLTWGQWCEEIAKRAVKAKIIDAIWFKKQVDIGTAIINRDQFESLGVMNSPPERSGNSTSMIQSSE